MILAASHVHVFGEDRPSQNNRPALVDNSGSSASLGVPRLAFGKHRRLETMTMKSNKLYKNEITS